jgi:uroporphyrinogen-III synthase
VPPSPSFDGARVLLLESRRARELASIVTSYGGMPVSAPSMREVPLESNTEAAAAVRHVIAGAFDVVILLTGVGARAWLDVAEQVCRAREPFVDALRRVKVAARGPKPLAVMRELQVPVWVTAPEPNTWRELLAAIDSAAASLQAGATGSSPSDVDRQGGPGLQGARVAVQEYGATNTELLDGLSARGAHVTRVPVYQWALPEDLEPLREGIRRLAAREIDAVLFTTGTQAVHLMQVAESIGQAGPVRDALNACVVASIGPTTSEELRRQGIAVRFEPSHPKMGFLVREAAAFVEGQA